MNDLVSDTLIRIKNGYLAYKKEVLVSYSKLVLSIVKILEEEGYLESVEEVKEDKLKKLIKIRVVLKYSTRGSLSSTRNPAISDIKRISKPGLRIYKGAKSLPHVLNGLGIAIISTPKGVMTDKKARKEGVGGEIIAYVW